MNELDQLRAEAEQLKNAIRVSSPSCARSSWGSAILGIHSFEQSPAQSAVT